MTAWQQRRRFGFCYRVRVQLGRLMWGPIIVAQSPEQAEEIASSIYGGREQDMLIVSVAPLHFTDWHENRQ